MIEKIDKIRDLLIVPSVDEQPKMAINQMKILNLLVELRAEAEQLNIVDVSGSISSMKETMDSFFQEIEEEIKAEPNNMKLIGARWAYRIAMEQFHNRFAKYYQKYEYRKIVQRSTESPIE